MGIGFPYNPLEKYLFPLQIYLSNHRQGLDLSSHNVYDEMDFYTNNIQIFILWLYNSITESRYFLYVCLSALLMYIQLCCQREHNIYCNFKLSYLNISIL